MPPLPRSDKRYLEFHGSKWRVTLNVPRELRMVYGTKVKVPLGTDSLSEANRLKWVVVDRLKAQFKQTSPTGVHLQSLAAEALKIDAAYRAAVDDEQRYSLEMQISNRVDQLLGQPIGTDDDNEIVYDEASESAALTYIRIAQGEQTPIDEMHQRYLKTLDVKSRTMADDVRSIKYLREWAEANGIGFFLQSFGRKEAANFIDDMSAVAGDISPVTKNKYIRRLSLFWRWLEKREEVDRDIWDKMSLVKPQETNETLERPFTEFEMRTLLSGSGPQKLHDLMRIAALTGARLDVIVCLSVKDCMDGLFCFKPQKKERGSRLVPIHSDLEEIVQRRSKGKHADDPIFPEWPEVRAGGLRERSFKASNQFTDYRRAVGVDDVVDGKRRSRVNFHSFRRWFITAAEQADQPENIIAAVVGHTRKGITFGLYSKGPKLEQARKCIEAVRLPEL